MFGSEILDAVLGLVFIYLLLSLICSTVNELIEAWLGRRSTDLERGIRELLDDPAGTGLAGKLYNHPLISGLFRGAYDPSKIKGGHYPLATNLPSYIPARLFALALMDLVLPGQPLNASGTAGSTSTTATSSTPPANPAQELRQAAALIENESVRRALLALIDAAGNDIARARQNIEGWFNNAMDRVSGWYKRWSQTFILVLGVALTVALNADTISLVKSLAQSKASRDAMVKAAQDFFVQNEGFPGPGAPIPPAAVTVSTPAGRATAPGDDPGKRLKVYLDELGAVGLPIGWNRDDPRTVPLHANEWAVKVIGWTLTALAISLGAPFWFDVLNNIMVIRSTVKPHEKSREESSKN